MAYIRVIPENEAEGTLADVYQAARRRAGRVYNILRVQSVSHEALQGSIELYRITMFGHSPLTRAQREMLAVVVSRANDCHY